MLACEHKKMCYITISKLDYDMRIIIQGEPERAPIKYMRNRKQFYMYNIFILVRLWGRGGMKSLTFHVTCAHTDAHCRGCVPHIVAVLKLKNHGIPKGSLA